MRSMGQTSENPQCLCEFQVVCPIITRSSILRTIPVAFIIYNNLLALQNCTVSICKTRRFILEFIISQKSLCSYMNYTPFKSTNIVAVNIPADGKALDYSNYFYGNLTELFRQFQKIYD